ncbi:MAG: UPF0716 protein FxsA [Polyangiales bacterium]|jgi:UPF0716 protein FxsA
MGKWLLLLFTVVPFVEFYLLMKVGSLLGFWPTVGIVLATGMLGAALAKREGVRVLSRWQRDMSEGRIPEDGVLDGVLILVGGVLLVTPGVLTDALGLSLLIPWTRRGLSMLFRSRIKNGVKSGRVRVVQGAQPPLGSSPFAASPFGAGSFTSKAAASGQMPIDLEGMLRRAQGGHVIEVEGEELPVDPPESLP